MVAMTAGVALGQQRQLTMQERQEAATEEDLLTNGEYWRDYEEWMRTWIPIRKRWDWLESEEYVRGQEKRPSRRRMVVLDPPLPKKERPDTVEVETFLVVFDGPASERIWGGTATITLRWYVSWMEGQRGGVPVKFVWRIVGKGPNLLRQYNENRLLWKDIDKTGSKKLPEGRFVRATTTVEGKSLTFVGVCIPYKGYRTNEKRWGDKKKGSWDGACEYLDALREDILARTSVWH